MTKAEVIAAGHTVTANEREFDEMTRNLRIVFGDGSSTPYQNLVKGFVAHEGMDVSEAIVAAARAVAGRYISIVADSAERPLTLDGLQQACHDASYAAGWWHHPDTGLPYIPGDRAVGMDQGGCGVSIEWEHLPRDMQDMIIHYWPFVLATKMALIQSEVSEGLEALRRGAMDDKLAHRLGIEAELSDAVIREFDIAGAIARARSLGVVEPRDGAAPVALDRTIAEKMSFNRSRPDHKVAARRAAGGKAF